ncbi:unnamed protein product [Boreogadus saida]
MRTSALHRVRAGESLTSFRKRLETHLFIVHLDPASPLISPRTTTTLLCTHVKHTEEIELNPEVHQAVVQGYLSQS